MDSRSTILIEDLKQAMSFTDHTPEYKCDVCKDKGVIPAYENNQFSYKRCDKCYKKKLFESNLRRSGISVEDYKKYTFESFICDTDIAKQMKETAAAFLKDKTARGLGYFGRSGTGKTHICIAVCQASGKVHHYWQYRREIQKIKAVMYRDVKEYEKLMSLPINSPFLYIDDFLKCGGNVLDKDLSHQDLQIMFDIINARYINRRKTIISSERTLKEIFTLDEAIGSRLYEMLSPYIVKVEGQNRRIINANKILNSWENKK